MTTTTSSFSQIFSFFGLREDPFHVSPNPRFYFSTPVHDAALTQLLYGVHTRQGFLLLTGEAGTGKTTVLNQFLSWLADHKHSSAYVFHSRLDPVELFQFVLRDFGISTQSTGKGELVATLHQWLLERNAVGDSPVIIVDEAQALSARTLDELRLLLNLENANGKLLQIILAGQPELEEKLRRPELRQLRQRVMFQSRLSRLTAEQASRYISSRLCDAGAANPGVFPPETVQEIHACSRGIPRLINLLCEHSLINAYASHETVVSPESVRRIASEFDLYTMPVAPNVGELSSPFVRLGLSAVPEERSEPSSFVLDLNSVRPFPSDATFESSSRREIPNAPVTHAVDWQPLPFPAARPILEPVESAPPSSYHRGWHKHRSWIVRFWQGVFSSSPPPSPSHPRSRHKPEHELRITHYWREVCNSFVQDWRMLVRTLSLPSNFDGLTFPAEGGSAARKGVLVPISRWLRQPITFGSHRKDSPPPRKVSEKNL